MTMLKLPFKAGIPTILAGLAFLVLLPTIYLSHMYVVGRTLLTFKHDLLQSTERFLMATSIHSLSCEDRYLGERLGSSKPGDLRRDQHSNLSLRLARRLVDSRRRGYAGDSAWNLHNLVHLRLRVVEPIRVLTEASIDITSHLRLIEDICATACRPRHDPPQPAWVDKASLKPHLDAIKPDLATMQAAYAAWDKHRPIFLATVWTLIVLEVVGYGCAFWLIVSHVRERRRRRGSGGPAER